jgi:hypothetical protein
LHVVSREIPLERALILSADSVGVPLAQGGFFPSLGGVVSAAREIFRSAVGERDYKKPAMVSAIIRSSNVMAIILL